MSSRRRGGESGATTPALYDETAGEKYGIDGVPDLGPPYSSPPLGIVEGDADAPAGTQSHGSMMSAPITLPRANTLARSRAAFATAATKAVANARAKGVSYDGANEQLIADELESLANEIGALTGPQ